MDYTKISSADLKELITEKVARFFGVKFEDANTNQMYQAVCLVVRDMLTQTRVEFKKKVREKNSKHVYYMSMEFLLGRSLKNHLYNMGLENKMTTAVADLGFNVEELFALEPDAGLG
ncbi:MAG: alpha-glucan phosphorylase, partial [Clostridia bacterium]